jgi:hypothetical protein
MRICGAIRQNSNKFGFALTASQIQLSLGVGGRGLARV